MSPSKEEIKVWLKKHGRTREWLGEQCGGASKNTVNNWLSTSIDIPSGMLTIIRRLMEDDNKREERESVEVPSQNLVLKISEEQFRRWEKAARKRDLSILDYSIQALEEAAKADLESGFADLKASSDKKKSGFEKIRDSFKKQ